MDKHPITWTAPEPLWKEAINRADAVRAPMAAPAILRFATDDFMPEFLNVLSTDPHRLGEYRVVKETWRGVVSKPVPLTPKRAFALPFQRLAASRQRRNGVAGPEQGRKPAVNDEARTVPLKLYQPAHQRFYLVTSSLVCELAGLPDRKVDPGRHEQAGFVMRRLLKPKTATSDDPAQWPEHAWAEEGGVRRWRTLDDRTKRTLFPGEELLPLFGTNHTQDDRRPRRMFAGLIPVGKREAYLAGGGPDNAQGGITPLTARKTLLRKEVIEPWKGLIARAELFRRNFYLDPAAPVPANDQRLPDPERARALKAERAQIQATSWLILLDLAKFLDRYAHPLWQNLVAGTSGTNPAQVGLLAELGQVATSIPAGDLPPNLGTALGGYGYAREKIRGTLAETLRLILAQEQNLERAEREFSFDASDSAWPPFLFPLADPEFPTQAAGLRAIILPPLADPAEAAQEAEELRLRSDADDSTLSPAERVDRLAALILRALDEPGTVAEPAVPLAAQQPAQPLEGWFVIRCVYTRPGCGPLHEDVVSDPSEPFQLAGFFDPDAPARPIRIGLPIDTTAAGLRKFDRNTAFVISDTLCGQIARLKGLTLGDLVRTVLPWPLHKDLDVPDSGPCKNGGDSFGMICSLSIPIITICALILLMIMVSLLEIIFHWIPYFILCFPVPGLKAKKP